MFLIFEAGMVERLPVGLFLDTASPDMNERIEIFKSVTADQTTHAGGVNILLKKTFRLTRNNVKWTISREYSGAASLITGNFAEELDNLSIPAVVATDTRHIFCRRFFRCNLRRGGGCTKR